MNRIGFMVSDQDSEEQEDQGYAESLGVHEEESWTDGLGDFLFQSVVRFCMVYGLFAAVRDLVRSLV